MPVQFEWIHKDSSLQTLVLFSLSHCHCQKPVLGPTIPRHSNWTKLAPDPVEDPEVVPPATEEENPAQEEGDQSCSYRGSRSCSSSTRRRPKLLLPRIQKLFLQLKKKETKAKLLLPRFQKLFLQLPETSQRSHPP